VCITDSQEISVNDIYNPALRDITQHYCVLHMQNSSVIQTRREWIEKQRRREGENRMLIRPGGQPFRNQFDLGLACLAC
jgi:hypothetical protein